MENKEKDVILVNRMCTGTYTINNIGHEIINYFKASNKTSSEEMVYIYISPYGSMDPKYDGKIESILLTSALSNHKIEIIAKIDNPEQEIDLKKIKEDREKNKEGYLKEVHREQLEKYKNVLYGGKTLEEIFAKNYNNEEAIHVTFKVKPENMKKPKNGKHIYITDSKDYKNKKFKNEKCEYIVINKNLASTSLKQYFKKTKNKNDEHDYNEIKKCLDSEEWEDFNPEEIIIDKKSKLDENINFLQLIEKEDEEQIYTNMLWYWFSRNNIFNEFLKSIKFNILIDKYSIEKEKVISSGQKENRRTSRYIMLRREKYCYNRK